MVNIGNLIGELRLSGRLSKQVADLFVIYAGWWVLSQIIAIIVIVSVYASYYINVNSVQFTGTTPPAPVNLYSVMSGFSLFTYFPESLRFILFIYIVGAVVCIPFFVFTSLLLLSPTSSDE